MSLDLPLDAFDYVIANRIQFKQVIIDFKKMNGSIGHDDELHFNTQSSSQWDGLSHCAVQEQELYYNGLRHEDVMKRRDGRNGTHSKSLMNPSRMALTQLPEWVEAGGIVSRGVLLDYVRWRAETGQEAVRGDSPHSVTVSELKAMAKYFKIDFRPGDILILRAGFTIWHKAASPEERKTRLIEGAFIGVERSMEMVRFLWNHHFAAVATDSIGFEQCPVPFGQKGAIVLHEWILAHWGMPLGELWNLEGLSDLCHHQQQWSFLFTSAPLYVIGGVGSPPNAIALL